MLHSNVGAVSKITFLSGGGETGALIRTRDWSATPLGPPETWPSALKTAIGLMLGAAQPVCVAWGAELTSFYNDGYLPIIGSKHSDGLGKPFAELWAEIWDEFRPTIGTTMSGQVQRFVSMPVALARRRGLPMGYFTFSYSPLRDEAGEVAGFYCAATETTHTVLARHWAIEGLNVTENHQASERIRQSEAPFRAVFENVAVGVACVPLEDECWLDVNDALCRMLGYSRAGLLATKLGSILHPEDRGSDCSSFLCKDKGCVDPFVVEVRLLHRSGEPVWVRQTVSLVRDAAGQPEFQIAVIEDISEQKKAEAELHRSIAEARKVAAEARKVAAEARKIAAEARKVALTDSLTGLPNRAAFRQKLEAAVAKGGPLTLILIDADHLKRANDTDGHAAGDALLCRLSNRLKAVTYPGAVAARLGGDEFALLLEDYVETERLDIMLGELCRPFHLEGLTLRHTASAGIAYPSLGGSTASELMQRADLALYEAKAKGRATWQIFDHALSVREQSKIAAIALLRRALDEQWIAPYYQPKVSLGTGQIVGFEALLRICRPGGSLHTAGMVSQALREPDLAAQVDRLVLRRVLLDIQRWQAQGNALPVAVNLTDSTIRRQGFARDLLDLMTSCGSQASLLELEITETVLLDRRDETPKENLVALSQAGFRIALDDFGTGYASLAHLRTYPVNQIKIDQQFVKAALTSHDDRAIISAILGLGESLSMQVIAEGIETEAQRRILVAAGCEVGQGFLFSPAVPAEAVPELLASKTGLPVRCAASGGAFSKRLSHNQD